MPATRRSLSFASVDQVMQEVDRLLAGHTTVGNWSLGQICSHLERAVDGSVTGFAERAPWPLRKTIGPWLLKRILRTGSFPKLIKLPKRYEPRPGSDARTEAEALRAALARYVAHPGPFAWHPLADVNSREMWDQLHCIHCAHHLGFALPI